MRIRELFIVFAITLFFLPLTSKGVTKLKPTPIPIPTSTLPPKNTPTPTSVITNTPVVTPTNTPLPTNTPIPTEVTPVSVSTPYPGAPLCETHSGTDFHTLWNPNGCHYDHEHGEDPFTQVVTDTFPGFNLFELLGGVKVGHTNPSSPMENTMKHGGMKWQVNIPTAHPCEVGFEGATVGINAAVIQFHAFGDYAIEFEARKHSTVALLRQCLPENPNDAGYIYVVQLQEYGQRVVPYQGTVFPYPDNPVPSYAGGFGPYFTTDCVGPVSQCRSSLDFIRGRNLNTNSIWTSKPTGSGVRPQTSILFRLLFRVRDTYQVIDWNDQVHPFTWKFICSSDGGITYNPVGCRYNNSTATVHEIAGTIPTEWDNLAGWDTDPRIGRVTAEGFVNQFGERLENCLVAGLGCYPIKLVSAFVNNYGAELSVLKVSNPTVLDTPEDDIYFCGNSVCSETSTGAIASGWIGPEN